jgi:hypothetical protein
VTYGVQGYIYGLLTTVEQQSIQYVLLGLHCKHVTLAILL